MMLYDYILMFATGLLSSVHCIGMCGGLIAACGMKFKGGIGFSITYNTGRILSYSVLGIVMGTIGKALIAAGGFGKVQGFVPIVAGLLMIVIGFDLLGLFPVRLEAMIPRRLADLLLGNELKRVRPFPFVLGVLNGLIPCGLLYAAGIRAAATGDPLPGMLTMLAFGAGTIPALITAGILPDVISRGRSGLLGKISGVLIIILGARSISFGWDYLSVFLSL